MDPEALLTGVLLLIVGFVAGVRQDREKTRYEQRTRIVTEIRERLRELQDECLTWSAPPEERFETFPERREHAREIFRKLAGLDGYYEASKLWLQSRTRELYERIYWTLDDPILDFLIVLEAKANPEDASLLNPRYADEDQAAAAVHDWATNATPGGLPALMREWEREVERVIGSRPWWRRMFGGGGS